MLWHIGRNILGQSFITCQYQDIEIYIGADQSANYNNLYILITNTIHRESLKSYIGLYYG